jgi:uncharacterized damage-inducible protein DinB
MSNSAVHSTPSAIITPAELLRHWQGHRDLTKRVIVAFPEKEFFTFSIGGMRTADALTRELLSIAGPGIQEITSDQTGQFSEEIPELKSKDDYLVRWDETTNIIDTHWPKIAEARFREVLNLFGQYKSPVIESIFYFIDNEIHHRGQMYVYLRALGIEPPAFWDRAH